VGTEEKFARLTIDLTGIDQVPLHFRVSPHSDVVSLAGDALNRLPCHGLPAQRALVRDALRRLSPHGLRVVAHSSMRAVWEGLIPMARASRHAYRVFDAIDRDVDTLRRASESEYGEDLPRVWRAALARPERFFDTYAEDCTAVWQAFGPQLGDLQPLLERESERVGTATVRGTLPEMLASAVPGSRLEGNELTFRTRSPARLTIAKEGLTIGTAVNGLRSGGFIVKLGTTELTGLWYPAPGVRDLLAGRSRRPTELRSDSLTALIGLPRTVVLRHLDRPASATALAELLHSGPSAVTYHVDALVAAGLVERRREGRYVLVARTSRGDRLLDLYAG
jgi:DNA-binding transcriptional ArsR family regulator